MGGRRCRTLAIVFGVLLVAALLIDFFPTFGPPQFRYTGSDPNTHVWNLGWPLATTVYDQRWGLHASPFAYVLFPIEVVVLVPAGIAVRMCRARSDRRQAMKKE